MIEEGNDVVFNNDEELVYFLEEKIQKFREKILEIDNYCQLLQEFSDEYAEYVKF